MGAPDTASTARAMSLESVRRDEVDGVPVLWLPGTDDTVRATLWIRAGMVDLPLVRNGWLHLLEHMALHGQDSVRAPVNGHVGLLATGFHVQGDPADVVLFLGRLCSWLARPDLTSVDHEARVLRAEAARRARGPMERHLVWRYGARGPGLAGYDEFGLYTLEPDGLADLARTVFTRGNSILSLNGAPPSGLSIPLPDGPRRSTPTAEPCAQPYPAGFHERFNGVSLSGAVPRSSAATALARLLERGLHRQFRESAGIGYSANSGYEPVDAHTAVICAGIDVLPEARDHEIVDRTYKIVFELAEGRLSATDVDDDRERVLREMSSVPVHQWAPFAVAREDLIGSDAPEAPELVARVRAVSGLDIAEAARELLASLLIGTDPGVPRGTRLPWLDEAPRRRIELSSHARQFRPVDYPLNRAVLTVSDQHATLAADDQRVAVSRADLVAVLAWPDGGRALVRDDGYQVRLEPTLWRDGAAATELIDRLAGDDHVVRMPERVAADIPKPATTRRQRALARLPWARTFVRTIPYLVAILIPAGVVASVSVADGADGIEIARRTVLTLIVTAWLTSRALKIKENRSRRH